MVKALLLACLLAGCTTPRGSFCSIADPVRFSDASVDAMTNDEVKAALAHNLKGKKLCDWKP